jgi:hypothetical protein
VDRRRFLLRGTGLGLGIVAGGAALDALSDEGMPDVSQAHGMITPPAQEAIDRGLAYLAGAQRGDGSFGTNQHMGSVAVTSLCGLAFMAGGHQPGRGRYGRQVLRALQYVLEQEQATYMGVPTPGFLCNPRALQGQHGPMYGHGFGTLFLAEAYGMVHGRDLRERLRGTLGRAVQLIINTQNFEGGWRYRPIRGEADLSVTICQIMALRAARNAGFSVPRSVADRCTQYVKDCQDFHNGGGAFRYMRQGGRTSFALTGAGVVALYSAGVYKGPAVERGLDYLMRNCKPGQQARGGGGFFMEHDQHYYYGHYYAAQAMWTAGGRFWREWYPAIREELLHHANYNRTQGFWYDGLTCQHYCTAMALIVLQIPNNYLPILQR